MCEGESKRKKEKLVNNPFFLEPIKLWEKIKGSGPATRTQDVLEEKRTGLKRKEKFVLRT